MGTNKLTDRACRAATAREKPYKLADGGGLFLHVLPAGGRYWRLAYRFEGRQLTAALGVYPEISLAEARTRRAAAKALLARGVPPSRANMARMEGGAHSGDGDPLAPCFRDVARRWIAARETGWTARHTSILTTRLERWVFPAIGSVPIAALTPQDVLAVLRTMEDGNAVTLARRMKSAISRVFRFAVAEGLCAGDPTVHLSAALRALPPVRHNPQLAARDLPVFLARLDAYDGDERTHLALRFVLHTMVRTKEMRFAMREGEFDFDGDAPLWRIPAERMKKARPHLVPLSPQALAIYQRLRALSVPGGYLAPGLRGGPMSENTMLFALYRLGYKGQLTVHGLRGTASTILNEAGLFAPEWIERQLAHDDDDKVRAAYNAAQYLQQRRDMLCWWSDYIDKAELVAP